MTKLLTYNPTIKPGILEVYCGPMKSGKTRELAVRLERLIFMGIDSATIIKPKIDTREEKVKSRDGAFEYDCF